MMKKMALKIVKTILIIVVFKPVLSSFQDFIYLIPLFLTPLFMEGFPLPFDLNLPAEPDPAPDPAADPDVYHPLINDNDRRTELENQLRTNWLVRDVTTANNDTFDRLISTQVEIEKAVERTLLNEHYSAQSILEKRTSIRGLMFYPTGRALSLRTCNTYLAEIRDLGTQGSAPYRRIMQAIQSSHLLLDRTDGRLF